MFVLWPRVCAVGARPCRRGEATAAWPISVAASHSATDVAGFGYRQLWRRARRATKSHRQRCAVLPRRWPQRALSYFGLEGQLRGLDGGKQLRLIGWLNVAVDSVSDVATESFGDALSEPLDIFWRRRWQRHPGAGSRRRYVQRHRRAATNESAVSAVKNSPQLNKGHRSRQGLFYAELACSAALPSKDRAQKVGK